MNYAGGKLQNERQGICCLYQGCTMLFIKG